MKAFERKARADVRRLPDPTRSSATAAAYIDLARRLDGDLPAQDAVLVSRELRIAWAKLSEHVEGVSGEVERYLQTVSNSAFSHGKTS